MEASAAREAIKHKNILSPVPLDKQCFSRHELEEYSAVWVLILFKLIFIVYQNSQQANTNGAQHKGLNY